MRYGTLKRTGFRRAAHAMLILPLLLSGAPAELGGERPSAF